MAHERRLIARLLLFALDEATKTGHLGMKVPYERMGVCTGWVRHGGPGEIIGACSPRCQEYQRLCEDAADYLDLTAETDPAQLSLLDEAAV